MEKSKRCDITWCASEEPLLRRRKDSPLYKLFGAAVLCSTHVPPWRKEEYEPLDAPPPPPAPSREEAQGREGEAPGGPGTPPLARGEARPHPPIPRTRGKAKAEGAPF
jgi:hypothetical protein